MTEPGESAARPFLGFVGRQDLDGICKALSENVVQHYPAPAHQADDGKHDATSISSREAISEEIRKHFHDELFHKETVVLTTQNLVGDGDLVAGRFILEARTTG